jgi:hypothetical protein
MAIRKEVIPQKQVQMNEAKLGVSLSDVLPKTTASREDSSTENEIHAYAKDIRRSLFAGGAAIVIELVLYFSHVIK